MVYGNNQFAQILVQRGIVKYLKMRRSRKITLKSLTLHSICLFDCSNNMFDSETLSDLIYTIFRGHFIEQTSKYRVCYIKMLKLKVATLAVNKNCREQKLASLQLQQHNLITKHAHTKYLPFYNIIMPSQFTLIFVRG